ncbi:hypothetical protein ZEAMMB73_Zm00001d041835 [Zea mays]|uniref:Uncharacterized protein n=1 Tax=Zea mays TaxID=4577 RepID=A0A1D6MYM0_MAIZE|nr:hypothetical protein ZEAMMB73_Zm00001d041835 [Zea mays]
MGVGVAIPLRRRLCPPLWARMATPPRLSLAACERPPRVFSTWRHLSPGTLASSAGCLASVFGPQPVEEERMDLVSRWLFQESLSFGDLPSLFYFVYALFSIFCLVLLVVCVVIFSLKIGKRLLHDRRVDGTTYKAVLEDGTTVVVKRLKEVVAGKREFEQQMELIGKVPLCCFACYFTCFANLLSESLTRHIIHISVEMKLYGIAGCLEEDDGGLFPPPPAIEEGKSVADKGLPRNCGGREGGGAIRAATTPHHLGEAINVRYNLVFGSPDVIAVECKKSHASWIVLDK